MRARLRELGQPIYGRNDELWARLADAERRLREHQARVKELERMHEAAVQGAPSIAPRMVAGPSEPSPAGRAAHEPLHLTRADKCDACIRGNETTEPRTTLTFDRKDTGKAQITVDFCYLKTDGDKTEIGDAEPPPAEIFATTLVMADRDTLLFNAVSVPTKSITDYLVCSVCGFMKSMHLGATASRRW